MLISNLNKDCIINTKSGDIRGFTEGSVNSFLGVPYATKLKVENRFCSPEPVQHSDMLVDATKNGPIAPQRPSRLARAMGDFTFPYDENCLTLNIWAPAIEK